MAYNVFISYSTADLKVVEKIRDSLQSPFVNVFIAEYSVAPSQPLAATILQAIKACDIFVLLWSNNSQHSEWVPQEIGIAKGSNRAVLPIVLHSGLQLPGFIRELKYLDATGDPSEVLAKLQHQILTSASMQQQRVNGLIVFGLAAALLYVLGGD